MPAAQGLYAETITDIITLDVSEGFVDNAEIPAASFTASKKYLIIAQGIYSGVSATLENTHRLVHGPDGSEVEFTDATYTMEGAGGGANAGYQVTWLYVYDQPATTEQVKIQQRSGGANDLTCHVSQIVALKLSDDFVENTDWFYNEVTADYTHTTAFVDQANVTFTPNGTDDWLLLGHAVADIGIVSAQLEYQFEDSVGPTVLQPLYSVEGETATGIAPALLVRAQTPTNASHNFAVQARDEAIGNVTLSSRIFALNLNKLRQHFVEYTEADLILSVAFTTVESAAITPEVTGNWFYIGSVTHDVVATANELLLRLQDDDDGSMGSDPAYGDDQPQDWAADATDEGPFIIFKMKSLTSGGTRTINVDAAGQSGTTGAVEDRSLIGFSLELPDAGGAFSLDALPGSYALSGIAAIVPAARLISALPGDYDLTGVAATIPAGRAISALPGSYSVAGVAAGVLADHLMSTDPGIYALTGQDAALVAGRILAANPGAYVITGIAAELSTVGAFVLAADPGSYVLTGQLAGVFAARIVVVNPGAYVLTGQPAGVLAGRLLAVDPGSYSLTGQTAGLLAARLIIASPGTIIVTGQDASLVAARVLQASPGAYALTGFAAELALQGIFVLSADPGAYVLNGASAGLVAARIVMAEPGAFVITGEDADLIAAKLLAVLPGSYTLTGADATLFAGIPQIILWPNAIAPHFSEEALGRIVSPELPEVQ